MCDSGFGVFWPFLHHLVRIAFAMFFHGGGRSAVRVTFPEHGVYCASEYLSVSVKQNLLLFGCRVIGIVRDIVTLLL